MRDLISCLLFLIAIAFSTAATCADDDRIANDNRPNVVIFLSDDQGWGDFSINGNRDLLTPNIDRLAKSGSSFENFYVCPVCSATRAEFLTGRYHPRGGVWSTSAGGERLDLDESTLAESYKAAGYATAAFGKWHNGMQPPYHPNARGFAEFYGFCGGHWGNYFSPLLEHNGELVHGDGFIVDDLTNHAIKFIEDNHDKPFLVYLPYNTPHSPMQVPDKYWARFADKPISQPSSNPPGENITHTRAALAMCENIDDNVGRLLQKLDELKLTDNTIAIYFCDNGPNGWRFNGGMKGSKGSTDEGGVRSPLFVRWPGMIKPGTQIKTIAGAIDLRPTLLELCGVEDRPNKPLDGISLLPELLGNQVKVKSAPRFVFSHWDNRVSVRSERFRLDHEGQLFDLELDRNQTTPVNQRHSDVAQGLTRAVAEWRSEVLGELDREPKPFTVGHPDFSFTQLPARDATATGQIKRSNKYPNSSFFTNWIDAQDEILWPVDVLAEGTFQVELYYTCREADVGTVLELAYRDGMEKPLADARVSKRIDVANDSHLIGADEDRFLRQESYEKDFKPVVLGELHLQKGSGQLVLRASEIPGERSIDFRLMMLRRIDK